MQYNNIMRNILLTIIFIALSMACWPTYAEKIKVKKGQSWYSLFPSEHERSIVMRVNHKNGELWPGLVLNIPDDLSTSTLLDYSPLPRMREPQGEKLIVVDLSQHAWGAYDTDGTLVRWGPATGGRKTCTDDETASCLTKEGEFRIYSAGTSSCVSSKYPVPHGGAPMPYCMFFHGGQALHGSPRGVIKANVSHGCVRIFVQDAEWLRYSFVEPPMVTNNYRGTKIIVVSSLTNNKKEVIRETVKEATKEILKETAQAMESDDKLPDEEIAFNVATESNNVLNNE